jgi:hypothetical protein
MEKPIKKVKLPRIDSIQELAKFWDTHELTDFEDELAEVSDPVFVRGTPIKAHLPPREVEAIRKIAQSKGLSQEELIREWILQKLSRLKGGGPSNRRSRRYRKST